MSTEPEAVSRKHQKKLLQEYRMAPKLDRSGYNKCLACGTEWTPPELPCPKCSKERPQMNPPILPWHLTVGAFAADRTRAAVAGLEPSKTSARDFAALVAEHDPAAQHEETVRLLERALDLCGIGDERIYKDIAAHLRTLRGEKGTE